MFSTKVINPPTACDYHSQNMRPGIKIELITQFAVVRVRKTSINGERKIFAMLPARLPFLFAPRIWPRALHGVLQLGCLQGRYYVKLVGAVPRITINPSVYIAQLRPISSLASTCPWSLFYDGLEPELGVRLSG